ncbi:hypothetical protein QBC41DRAFT_331575 [Cercophora samala]|uniref:Uncharacterized protein n=1 Tax=Cercophora samala TaxID=330535 RepID=A0AA39YVU8_9PEZI|nr:hypothetical protein QBC41DRAFT_331575 [Cercophora samala]
MGYTNESKKEYNVVYWGEGGLVTQLTWGNYGQIGGFGLWAGVFWILVLVLWTLVLVFFPFGKLSRLGLGWGVCTILLFCTTNMTHTL